MDKEDRTDNPLPLPKPNGFRLGLGGCPFSGGGNRMVDSAERADANNNRNKEIDNKIDDIAYQKHSASLKNHQTMTNLEENGIGNKEDLKTNDSEVKIEDNDSKHSKAKVTKGTVYGAFQLDEDSCREIPRGGMLYGDYLQIEKLLSCQAPVTRMLGNEVHDEHLFIITHQAYELWFKQLIYEIDSVREVMGHAFSDENNLLIITSRLNRIVLILKLLVDQVTILETMTPLDFMEFREFLSPASGFQSVQFRLLENKLGVRNDLRTNYGKAYYLKIFQDPKVIQVIKASEDDNSLSDLLQAFLESTPGLDSPEFNFWQQYKATVMALLNGSQEQAESEQNQQKRADLLEEVKRKRELFDSIFDVTKHNALKLRGDRRLSHKAFQGALMISLYRDEPRFNQPFQILLLLMDIDSLITKWRSNHVEMVLRMIGAHQFGTGGSSGYQYLRSTLSDRYKIFVDLFNLSNFLIPRHSIPRLTEKMKKRLSILSRDRLNVCTCGCRCLTCSGGGSSK